MKRFLPLLLVAVLVSAGCGDSGEGHAWKGQTDAIDKAADVENLLLETSQKQYRQAEEQAR